MSDTTTQSPWPPIPGQRLAWCPPGNNPALAAIPISREFLASKTLKGAQYRQLLTDRVAWMISLLPEREQKWAVRLLEREMETRGLWMASRWDPDTPNWNRVQALLVDNLMWPDYLNLVIELPDWPAELETSPEAVYAIEETSVDEWINLAFLPMHSLE